MMPETTKADKFLEENPVMDEGKASKKMVDDYLVAMLWSTIDVDSEDDDHLDDKYSLSDVSREARKQAEKDCSDFLKKAEQHISTADDGQVGHDFWLTRNGHVSFRDRDKGMYTDPKKMDAIAQKFKELEPYAGDDGKIYF
jgi:hypothetical protein